MLGTSEQNVASIFNSFIAAGALAAAWEIGALDELAREENVDIAQFARRNEFDVKATFAMFTALTAVQITEVRLGNASRSVNFNEAYRTKSFFHWLVRGSGDLVTRMPELLRNSKRVGDFYHRDAAAISVACKDINATFFDPTFWNALDGADFSKVVDLGCGSGERLLQILRRFPDAQGIGVDIADGALQVARATAAKTAMRDRVVFTKADARHLELRPEFADADFLTCFLMGHDFWPLNDCVTTLQRIRDAFPNVTKFFLGDTAKTTAFSTNFPIFTLGFEVGHALMGAYLPTLDEWEVAIDKSGWICVDRHLINTPADTVIFELEPR